MSSLAGPHPITSQLLRFSVVGCLNVAVSFAVFFALYRVWPLSLLLGRRAEAFGEVLAHLVPNVGTIGIDAAAANAVGYLAGMMNSFVLNKWWTFEAGGKTGTQMWRFTVLNALGLAMSSASVFLFVDVLRVGYLPVWIGTTAVVMVFNFLGNKHWTFVGSEGRVSPTRR
jgi:putative flippase GtrA